MESTAVATARSAEAMTKHEIEVKRLCGVIVELAVRAGEKYRELVVYVRKHNIGDAELRPWLVDCGFAPSRVSEIVRLSTCSEELFKEYEAKRLGWHRALQLSRDNLDEMKKVSPELVDKSMIQAVKEEQAEAAKTEREHADETKGERGVRQKAAKKRAMDRGAQLILKAAGALKPRGKYWNIGTGYTLTLAKDVLRGDESK